MDYESYNLILFEFGDLLIILCKYLKKFKLFNEFKEFQIFELIIDNYLYQYETNI